MEGILDSFLLEALVYFMNGWGDIHYVSWMEQEKIQVIIQESFKVDIFPLKSKGKLKLHRMQPSVNSGCASLHLKIGCWGPKRKTTNLSQAPFFRVFTLR